MAERRGASRGWGWSVAGITLAIVGFAIVLFAIWTANPVSIPLNNTTFAGAGIAAVGVAAAAIGLDRGAPSLG